MGIGAAAGRSGRLNLRWMWKPPLSVDPETALRETNQRFEYRFRRVEALAAERGQAVEGLGVEALDALWEEAKAEERTGGA